MTMMNATVTATADSGSSGCPERSRENLDTGLHKRVTHQEAANHRRGLCDSGNNKHCKKKNKKINLKTEETGRKSAKEKQSS